MSEFEKKIVERAIHELRTRPWIKGMMWDSDGGLCARGALRSARNTVQTQCQNQIILDAMNSQGPFPTSDIWKQISHAVIRVDQLVDQVVLEQTNRQCNAVEDYNDHHAKSKDDIIAIFEKVLVGLEEKV